VLEKYPKEVKLVHKFVPAHDFTWKAAAAALAADEQGKFWEYHDQLFENQLVLNEAKLIAIAGMLKLDLDRFRKKMTDPAVYEVIRKDFSDTKELGVTTTPWAYINGRHLKERTLPGFVKAIDQELKR
jgi:protein-disulfide isomerase